MNLTIVRADNLVIIDNQPQNFDLTVYDLPAGFWALQWQGEAGEIEFENIETQNEEINTLPEWTAPIIAEFDRIIKEHEDQEKEDEQASLYINNGLARKQRELNHLADTDPQAALKQLIAQMG